MSPLPSPSLAPRSMDGADLCFEIVKRADAGFVYSEAVARWDEGLIEFLITAQCRGAAILHNIRR